jgi:PPM family protein phosphatase
MSEEGTMGRTLEMHAASATHPGLQRQNNDDWYAVSEGLGLLLVADGVGGRPGGDVAAELAVATVHDALAQPETTWPADPVEARERLLDTIALANRRVREEGLRRAHLEGMATTLVAALVISDALWVAHVGDSRAYRLRDGGLERLTRDHRVEEDAAVQARLDPEQAAQLEPGLLTRAIGLGERVMADVRFVDLAPGDTVLLCTDGLTVVVEEREIAAVLDAHQDTAAAAAKLIERAIALGAPDNVTCVVARWAALE